MGLKKRNKVNPEFSMSSLTDIIFLLLIFFMLTANFVQIDPYELPESDSKTVAPTNIVVQIQKNGNMTLNSKKITESQLQSAVSREIKQLENKKDAALTIVAEKGVPFKKVSAAMEVAANLRLKAILATQPKS